MSHVTSFGFQVGLEIVPESLSRSAISATARLLQIFRAVRHLIFGWRDLSCSFMPSFLPEPFLKTQQPNLRKAPFQSRNVRLETRIVEPAKHLVKLLAKNQADKRQREPLKFDAFAQNATKNIRRLNIGEIAARNL